jgi:Response regulator containing CheY-like receiver, AAA-type ATPase, and DNA-binding domains
VTTAVEIELIHLIPTLIWALVLFSVVLLFRATIREQIFPRLTRFNAFGVEVEIAVKQELDRAAVEKPAGTEAERTQTARRAARLSEVLRGAHVLLVNDVPEEMLTPTSIMRSLGVEVDIVTSTVSALDSLRHRRYDVVVSDMVRESEQTAGLDLIQKMRSRNRTEPVILTVGRYEPERGVPPYAFGITNRVDELLNLLFDALERARG